MSNFLKPRRLDFDGARESKLHLSLRSCTCVQGPPAPALIAGVKRNCPQTKVLNADDPNIQCGSSSIGCPLEPCPIESLIEGRRFSRKLPHNATYERLSRLAMSLVVLLTPASGPIASWILHCQWPKKKPKNDIRRSEVILAQTARPPTPSAPGITMHSSTPPACTSPTLRNREMPATGMCIGVHTKLRRVSESDTTLPPRQVVGLLQQNSTHPTAEEENEASSFP